MPNKNRVKQIAEAFLLVAKANHYLVGFINIGFTTDELQQAEQVLIIKDNLLSTGEEKAETSLALDLIAKEIKGSKL